MIAELGFIDSLVGVSEECRWPPEVVGKPVVTAARIDPSSMSSLEIDEARPRLCSRRPLVVHGRREVDRALCRI